jgi:hypothetical protein
MFFFSRNVHLQWIPASIPEFIVEVGMVSHSMAIMINYIAQRFKSTVVHIRRCQCYITQGRNFKHSIVSVLTGDLSHAVV